MRKPRFREGTPRPGAARSRLTRGKSPRRAGRSRLTAGRSRRAAGESRLRAGRSRLTEGKSRLAAVAAVALVALAAAVVLWIFLGGEPASAPPPGDTAGDEPSSEEPSVEPGQEPENASAPQEEAAGAGEDERPQERRAEAAAEDGPSSAEQPPDADPGDLAEELNVRRDLQEQRYERMERDRAELREKLSAGDVTLDGRMRLLEEYIGKYGVEPDTRLEARQLAQIYYLGNRQEEGRQLYRRLLVALSGVFEASRQGVALQLAQMESTDGDLATAEKVLKDLMEQPPPEKYRQSAREWELQDFEVNRKIKAPLQLARVYRKQERFAEAREVLDRVEAFALSLPPDHEGYGNVAYFVGTAYSQRIGMLLNGTGEDEIRKAMNDSLALAEEYAQKLDTLEWPSNESHHRDYIRGQLEGMRRQAISGACRRKIELLFENAAPQDADKTLARANEIIEEYRGVGEEYSWSEQKAEWLKAGFERLKQRTAELAAEHPGGG